MIPPTSLTPVLGLDSSLRPKEPPPARTFNPWPISIIATFVVFICGTISLVVLATRDRSDLVAADYYEQEIRYQARIDQLQRTAPFASEIDATYDAASRRLAISLPPKHAAAGASGEIQLYRPNHSAADQSFPIATSPEGVQFLPAADLSPGLWKVRLHWKVAGEEFYADRHVVIAPPLRN